jgi:hypothetical protein
MKNYQEIIAEAARIEIDEFTGRVFIVFEVKNEKFKQDVKTNWTKDIEYKLIGKDLTLNNE